jgi:hypothetical protein
MDEHSIMLSHNEADMQQFNHWKDDVQIDDYKTAPEVSAGNVTKESEIHQLGCLIYFILKQVELKNGQNHLYGMNTLMNNIFNTILYSIMD